MTTCWSSARASPRAALTGLTGARKLVSKARQPAHPAALAADLPADATTSFRVFEPELARRFLRHGLVAGCTGYNFFSLFVLFAVITGPCREVPIHFRPRLVGSSKLTVQQCLQFARGLPDIRGRASQWKRVNAAEPFGDATDIGCLQELAGMPNYQRWIIEEIEPWLPGLGPRGRRRDRHDDAVPRGGERRHRRVRARTARRCVRTAQPSVCDGIEGATATLGTVEVFGDRRFDTVVYINCLEHIRDEEGELRRVQQHLAGPDAHLIIFSPALEFLYGELDRVSGHWRRYSRPSLLAAVHSAGYDVLPGPLRRSAQHRAVLAQQPRAEAELDRRHVHRHLRPLLRPAARAPAQGGAFAARQEPDVHRRRPGRRRLGLKTIWSPHKSPGTCAVTQNVFTEADAAG